MYFNILVLRELFDEVITMFTERENILHIQIQELQQRERFIRIQSQIKDYLDYIPNPEEDDWQPLLIEK